MVDWTISASKLKTIEECPHQFELRYIRRLEEMGPDSRWIRRGNAVHEAIEDTLRESSDPSVGSDILKATYRDNGGQDGYKLSDGFHQQVLSCLEAASRYLRKHVDTVRDIETEVEFGVTDSAITRDFGGYIDLTTGDRVVDWKTGKSEGKSDDDRLQGAVYMAGYAHLYGEPPESIDFAYLNEETGDDHPKIRSYNPDDELWETMLTKARQLMYAVEDGEYPARPDDSRCNFCDYEVFCHASPVGAGNVDWEAYP